jgi:hypothetical protein
VKLRDADNGTGEAEMAILLALDRLREVRSLGLPTKRPIVIEHALPGSDWPQGYSLLGFNGGCRRRLP